jgi:hypothetical protein
MTDIESMLRSAMHSAVDAEEASHSALVGQVRRRHRHHNLAVTSAAVLAVLAAVIPAAIAADHLTNSSPPLGHHVERPTPLPSQMRGLPMPTGTSFQLVITTADGAAWYSTATHKATPITGLPRSPGGYEFGRNRGGWALWPSSQKGYACSSSRCAGPPTDTYFLADGSTEATLIGSGNGVADSSATGSLWLVSYPHPTNDTEREAERAHLVSWTGRPLGPTYVLPTGYQVWRGVGSYLLLSPASGADDDELWDPRSRHVVRRFVEGIDAGPEQVVWSQGCASCRLEVLNVLTGKNVQTTIPANPPGGLNETLSDDGSLLAVQLSASQGLAVLNTGSGELTTIPGTALSSAEWLNFSWRESGHQLVISDGPNAQPGPMQIASWEPGATRLRTALVRNSSEITAFETGTVGS